MLLIIKVSDEFKDFKYLLIPFSWFTENSNPILVSTFPNLALTLRSDSICLSRITTGFPLSDFLYH